MSSERNKNMEIQKKELAALDSTNRRLFARLADLGFDTEWSMKIIAFWKWLESCGYMNVVLRLLQRSPRILKSFTKETIQCIYFLVHRAQLDNPSVSIEHQTKLIPNLLAAEFSHWFLLANREIVMFEIRDFVDKTCVPTFDVKNPEFEIWRARVLLPDYSSDYISFKFRGQTEIKERTIYLQFLDSTESRPISISKVELCDFLIKRYGYGIRSELVIKTEDRKWFTRVFMANKETVTKIFGEKRVVDLCINGNSGLARRFVTMEEAIHYHNLWSQVQQQKLNICCPKYTYMTWTTMKDLRKLYRLLVKTLDFTKEAAITALGFWDWLDNGSGRAIDVAISVHVMVLEDLANEALYCVITPAKLLKEECFKVSAEFMRRCQLGVSLDFVREHRDQMFKHVQFYIWSANAEHRAR